MEIAFALSMFVFNGVFNTSNAVLCTRTIASLANGVTRTNEIRAFLPCPMYVTYTEVPTIKMSICNTKITVRITWSMTGLAHMVAGIHKLIAVFPCVSSVTLARLSIKGWIVFPMGVLGTELAVAGFRSMAAIAYRVARCHVNIAALPCPKNITNTVA